MNKLILSLVFQFVLSNLLFSINIVSLTSADRTIENSVTDIYFNSINEIIVVKRVSSIIYNKDGLKKLDCKEYHDGSIEVLSLEAKWYDKEGKLKRKYDKSDFSDWPYGSGLYSDSRIFSLEINTYSFPLRVEYYSKVKYSNTLRFETWLPVVNRYVNINHAELKFHNPHKYKIRIDSQFVEKDTTSTESKIKWEINNFEGIFYEQFSGAFMEYIPFVKIVPLRFQYYDFQGEIIDWSDYSKWVYNNLVKDKINLNSVNKALVSNLVNDDDSDYVKAQKVYKYLQDNFRYISIQIGLGGIEPFDANITASKKYGDCKALTIYTKAALNSLGIKAIYSEVKSGYNKIDIKEDFVFPVSGDHVILCLPDIAKDTVWLECTSKNNPFGFLGDFTDDRVVVLFDEDGGDLVKTSNLQNVEDKVIVKANLSINGRGDIIGDSQILFVGNESVSNKYFGENYSEEEIDDYLKRRFGSHLEIDSIRGELESELVFKESFKLEYLNELGGVNGSSFSFNPNVLTESPLKLRRNSKRKYKVHIDRPITNVSQINYELEKYTLIDFVPENIEIVSEFGVYKRQIITEGKTIKYYRELKLFEGTHPKESYINLYKFIRKVSSFDKDKIYLKFYH